MKEVVSAIPHPHLTLVHAPVLWYVYISLSPLPTTDLPCRKAAVVLHASGTFLSLPGLDTFSRTTGMVAILFAAFSMAATGLAIFRHKADLERPISHVGIEGMMVITVRYELSPFASKELVCYQFLASFDIEANCYIISTNGFFGLFYHSVYHWHRSTLL